MCTITYLYSDQKYLCKQFIKNGDELISQPYDNGYYLNNNCITYNSLSDVYDDFRELAGSRRFCFIRGNIKPEYQGKQCRRLLHDDFEKGDKATIEPDARGKNLMMLDFDDVDNPGGNKPTAADLERLVVARLPLEFQDASFFFQFSSSAGVRGWDPFKVHLFYWTSTAWTDIDLRTWAQTLNQNLGIKWLDDRVFLSSQINYIADPLFKGMTDPLGAERWGFIQKGRDDVDLKPVARKVRFVPQMSASCFSVYTSADAKDNLKEKLAVVGLGGNYREPLIAAIRSYIVSCKKRRQFPDSAYLKRAILQHAGGALQAGGRGHYLDDQHLDDIIRWLDQHIILTEFNELEKMVYGIKKQNSRLMADFNNYKLQSILKGTYNETNE